MSMPLGRDEILKKYSRVHKYYDVNLVMKAYSRWFNEFEMFLNPPLPLCSGSYCVEEYDRIKSKFNNEMKNNIDIDWRLEFGNKIDNYIKEIMEEGLGVYNYMCDNCYKFDTLLVTDKEIKENKFQYKIKESYSCKKNEYTDHKCIGTMKLI